MAYTDHVDSTRTWLNDSDGGPQSRNNCLESIRPPKIMVYVPLISRAPPPSPRAQLGGPSLLQPHHCGASLLFPPNSHLRLQPFGYPVPSPRQHPLPSLRLCSFPGPRPARANVPSLHPRLPAARFPVTVPSTLPLPPPQDSNSFSAEACALGLPLVRSTIVGECLLLASRLSRGVGVGAAKRAGTLG